MTVAVELEAKRTPGRHPHVAEPQIVVDEIEIVVQALAVVIAKVGPAALLSCHGW